MTNGSPSDVAQFIVAPRTTMGDSSGSLAELLRTAPSRGITIVRVVGPAESPRRLVIRGSKAEVAKLGQQFATSLVIEEDRPLSPA